MAKILQIQAVNLPLVFDTSGVSLVSGTDLIAFKELSKAIDAIQKAGSVSEALANSDAKVSVSVGKGYANSDSQVQNHTEINADRLTIKAKETTTLKGATANINHLALDTKNLHIESVQDIEKYDSKQTQGGVKAAFAWGSGASGSAQFSRNKANVDYAQVNQQSGFNIKESSNINVEENTHLKGGVINAEGKKETTT